MTDQSGTVLALPPGPLQIVVTGRKGTGKSELTYRLWESWPGDRVVIDYTGDFYGRHELAEEAAGTRQLRPPFGRDWPAHLEQPGAGRLSLRYLPDHTDPAVADQIDAVVGMAYDHPYTLLVVEEMGEVAPVHRARPNMRRLLNMGRHSPAWSIFNGPRPQTVDPLVLANADIVYVFDLPQPRDRRRVADLIGWDPIEIDLAVAELPDHGYLRYVAARHELLSFPPLPVDQAAAQ